MIGIDVVKRTLQRHLPIAINRVWYKYRYGSLGDEFVNDDWDNLLIIDAARYDIVDELGLFREGDLREKYSPASFSLGFMRDQFSGRELHDTIYVTSNPHVEDISADIFHDVVHLVEQWDESLETVPPGEVVQEALRIHKKYPKKRYIIHFMQPHFPFITSTGQKIPAGFEAGKQGGKHPWNEQMYGSGVSREMLLQAYRENHEAVEPFAMQLINKLPNRTVVTADHANLIGERGFPIPIRMYGHPRNFPHPNLIRVPWIKYDGRPRQTVSEPPQSRNQTDEEAVEKRLNALGYR